MFESSQFLDLYMPDYFLKVFQRNCSNQFNKKIHCSPLKVVSQFVKFSYSHYLTQNLQKHFFSFLLKQLPFLSHTANSKSPKTHNCSELRKGKIMELMELNLDKIQQAFIGLYMKIFEVNVHTKDNSLQKFQITKYSEEILKDISYIRLLYQIQRFQSLNIKDFDDYIIQVFKLIVQDNITKDMEIIFKKILRDQCSNINDDTVQQIQTLMSQIEQKQSLKVIENNDERFNLNLLRTNLVKKHKKIQKAKNTFTVKKAQTQQNVYSSPRVDKKKQNHSFSPINRIKSYVRNKKEKPINKKRTIYYERKNVHVPKGKQWFDKISFFSTQLTLTSQLDKKTEKKLFKLQPSQSIVDDFDHESVLVRSTPKPNKRHYLGKMISHKLDF